MKKGKVKEVKQVEAKVEEVKGQKFDCGVCGREWESKVKRSGLRLCVECVEMRRAVNGFVKRGLELGDVNVRLEKVVELLNKKK